MEVFGWIVFTLFTIAVSWTGALLVWAEIVLKGKFPRGAFTFFGTISIGLWYIVFTSAPFKIVTGG